MDNNSSNTNQGNNIDQQLVQLIKYMNSKGMSFESIKKFLINKGYALNVIVPYYRYATNKNSQQAQPQQQAESTTAPAQQSFQQQQPIPQTQQYTQVQPTQQTQQQNNAQLVQIVDYVRKMEVRGYSFQQIKTFLLQRGYSEHLIDDAAAHLPQQPQAPPIQQTYVQPQQPIQQTQQAQTTTHKHEIHLPSKTAFHIFAIIIGVMIIGGGMFYFMNGQQESETLLDLMTNPRITDVVPGEDITFEVIILSMGSKETFDMFLTYRIIDSGMNIVLTKEDTIAVTTSAHLDKSITIPENFRDGSYILKVYSDYNGKIAQSSFEFRVTNNNPTQTDNGTIAPEPEPIIPGPEDPYINLPPEIETGNQNFQIIKFADFIDRIIKTSRNDPAKAAEKCKNIRETENIDRCLSNVAIEFNNSATCEEIENQFIRDDCYMAQMIYGDMSLCEKINDTLTRSNCNTLRDMYLVQQYQNTNASIEEIITELGINITIETVSNDEEIEVINLE